MTSRQYAWLRNKGEMGTLICEKNWTQTPLGPMKNWSEPLKNTVSLIIESKFPMVIGWGPELTVIYNNAYRPLLRNKPEALGSPYLEVWSEISDTIGPMVEKALDGESSYSENLEFTLNRNNHPEKAWFDFSYSPLRDEDGEVVGILKTAIEKTDQVKTKKSLRKREESYRTFFESMDQGFCIIQVEFDEKDQPVDYRRLKVNSAFEKHTGLKNVEGQSTRELLPEHEEFWFEVLGKVALTREPRHIEQSAKALSNRNYKSSIYPFGPPEEHKVVVIFEDVTKQKKAEKARRESERRLKAVLKRTQIGVWELNLQSGSVWHSLEHDQIFGFEKPVSDWSYDTFIQHVVPQDRERVNQSINTALEGDGKWEVECRIRRIDGVKRWIWIHGQVNDYDDDQDPKHMLGIVQDITKRKRRENRDKFMARLSRDLQSIGDPKKIMTTTARLLGDHLEVDHCVYAEIDKDEGHVTITSDYTRGDAVSMEGPWPLTSFGTKVLQVIQQNQACIAVDNIDTDDRLSKEDRETYHDKKVQAFIFAPLSKEGKIVAGMAVNQKRPRNWLNSEVELIKTVTNRCWEAVERARVSRELESMNETLEERVEERTKALKSYQEQLRSLATKLNKTEEKERQRIATELHENLGQMLAVCKMRLHTLERNGLSEDVSKEISDVKNTVDEVLSYSREMMAELSPSPTFNEEDFEEVVAWIAKKMKRYQLDVAIENDEQPKPLTKDTQRTLYHCIRELLFNIVKYADVNEASLTLIRKDDKVKIVVEDQGVGFELNGNKPVPTQEGGFGLFNIRERMNYLGGSLVINSNPGKGTKATLVVPIEETSVGQPSVDNKMELLPTKKSSDQSELQEIKVLLVDDHEMVRRGLRRMIEAQDDLKIVAEASNGKQAIELAYETIPDVIVMDVNMPVMDGIDATRKITSTLPFVRVVGLSLYNHAEVEHNMMGVGASAYLTKDEAFETLCETIRNQAYGNPE